jgi:hypothetical protein
MVCSFSIGNRNMKKADLKVSVSHDDILLRECHFLLHLVMQTLSMVDQRPLDTRPVINANSI